MDKFLKHLLPLFGRRDPASGCPEDGVCWAFAAGEPLPAASRRSMQRHVLRCPACMEKILVLRRLAGNTAPLIRHDWLELFSIQPIWRPLASVAAMLVLAVGLYLGGSSVFRVSEVHAPALPELKPAPPAAASQVPPPAAAAPIRRADAPAAPGKSPQPARPAPREQENTIAGRTAVFAPEPAALPAPAAVEEEKSGREERAVAAHDFALEGAGIKKEMQPSPAPPAAAGEAGAAGETPKLSTAATTEVKSLSKADSKGKRSLDEESVAVPNLEQLCREFRLDLPTRRVRQHLFFLINGYLVEKGVCDDARRPRRNATPQEWDRFTRTAAFPEDCFGAFLVLDGQIVYFPLRPR